MCVLALAWHAHPRWQLVMAGNRDELHDRPAAPLARWDMADQLIAGRDLQAGGTWLGLSEKGRFAVVTNLRGFGGPMPGMASRGALVVDLLSSSGSSVDLDAIDLASFNPFNLIVADPVGAYFLTNRPAPAHSMLAPGVYGLSNGALDAPWPKTMQLKAALLDWLMNDAAQPELLFDALRTESLPGFGLAPDNASDVPQEALRSPVFIRNPVYGTRCSTVVAIDRNGQGLVIERRFAADGVTAGETTLPVSWPAS